MTTIIPHLTFGGLEGSGLVGGTIDPTPLAGNGGVTVLALLVLTASLDPAAALFTLLLLTMLGCVFS